MNPSLKKIASGVAACAVASGAIFAVSTPAAYATHKTAGPVDVVNPMGGAPLTSGGSSTDFRFKLPSGSACSGDSANAGYRIQSYLVPQSVDLDTLKFDSSGPVPVEGEFRAPMFDVDGNPFVSQLTASAVPAGGPGVIIQPLSAFNFAVYDTVQFPVTPGVYNVGIACTLGPPSGAMQLDKYWNTVFTITADPSDPGPAKIRFVLGAPVADPHAVADFDGDGDTDRSVFRNGAWHAEGQGAVSFGLAGDQPVAGDYDGDGDLDRAVFRDGAWYTEGQAPMFFGIAGDIPVPGDYDGNGDTERAVYRNGAWFVEGMPTVFLGLAGDVPVPGDFDGDGDTDRAVFRNGAWYVEGQATIFLGLAGDVPVPGDFNGDGDTERAVYRDGRWFVEGQATVSFGLPGDTPIPLPQAIYRRFFPAGGVAA